MTTFPIIYIPVINDKVFLHAPISWEVRGLVLPMASLYILVVLTPLYLLQWAIVFIGALVFAVLVECWKFGKRVYFRREKLAHAAAIAGIPEA